jgi:hypothetical protein
MKLVNVALAFSYALLADARSANYGECTNSRSFKGVIRSGRKVTAEQYDANFDANFYKYLQAKQQNGNTNQKCSEMKEECAKLLEGLDIESFRDKTGGSKDCGKAADETIDNLLGCAMCERLNELEEADQYCAEDSNSMACVSRSVGERECPLTGDTAGGLMDCFAEEAKYIEENSQSVQTEDSDNNEQGIEQAGKAKKHTLTIYFNRCTGKVWNIVVSGGPEYCKDMFPKYPRVIHGKMRPGHPNYDAVVEIRDSCKALENIVKQTRCFCLYVNWGCNEYPKACGANHKRRVASSSEIKICYYFSNLKGTGVYKPRQKPRDVKCGKGPGGVPKPKPPSQIINNMASIMDKAKQKCKKFKNKKKKFNQCVKKQKKALS